MALEKEQLHNTIALQKNEKDRQIKERDDKLGDLINERGLKIKENNDVEQ